MLGCESHRLFRKFPTATLPACLHSSDEGPRGELMGERTRGREREDRQGRCGHDSCRETPRSASQRTDGGVSLCCALGRVLPPTGPRPFNKPRSLLFPVASPFDGTHPASRHAMFCSYLPFAGQHSTRTAPPSPNPLLSFLFPRARLLPRCSTEPIPPPLPPFRGCWCRCRPVAAALLP